VAGSQDFFCFFCLVFLFFLSVTSVVLGIHKIQLIQGFKNLEYSSNFKLDDDP
jgi:hypothetical protein